MHAFRPALRLAGAALALAILVAPSSAGTIRAAQTGRASHYPVTITNCGQTLTFTKAPSRVVSTFDNTSEILVKLGLGNRIVGTYYDAMFTTEPDIQAAYE